MIEMPRAVDAQVVDVGPVPDSHRIVFDVSRVSQAQAESRLFVPTQWPHSTPVLGSGRGSAWFVESPSTNAVLRHYRRGGLVAHVLGDLYLWQGAESTRSFAEFHLLAQMEAAGLPVPAALAARYERIGPWYRADILVERIAGAVPLSALLRHELAAAPWEAVGEAIAQFHRSGIDHADLNAHNILIDPTGRVWLIDFDRSRQRAEGPRWRHANLRRLRRSVHKLVGGYFGAALISGWSRLYESYAFAMSCTDPA